jgi:hypothetical protein
MRSIEAGGGYERLSSMAVDREILDAAYAVCENSVLTAEFPGATVCIGYIHA